MNTLVKGKDVHFDDRYLHVELEDGWVISTPIFWYKELQDASLLQLKNYQFICHGTGIEWSDIDYHLSIESMLVSQVQKKAAQLQAVIWSLLNKAPLALGHTSQNLPGCIAAAETKQEVLQLIQEAIEFHLE